MRKKLLVFLLAAVLVLGNASPGSGVGIYAADRPSIAGSVSDEAPELLMDEPEDSEVPSGELPENETAYDTENEEEPELEEDNTEEPAETSSDDADESETPAEDSTEESTEKHTHSYSVWKVTQKASRTRDGVEKKTCSCGKTKTRTIAHPAEIILSKTEYTYNGEAHRPGVKIKDSNGRRISKEYIKVHYENYKQPGTGKVIAEISSPRYSAVLTARYQILLPTVEMKDAVPMCEGLTASWTRGSSHITGYQLQYSTDRKFASADTKKISVKDRSTTNTTLKKLAGNTKYYLRVRTYRKTSKKTSYSEWSERIKVTTDETKTLTLAAVGDDLLHSPVYHSCKTKNGYNFDPLFANIKEDIQAADLAVINQETILVKSNYSSYPSFGSPLKVADGIANAGFDIVTCATNHTMDRGTDSISVTMNYWEKNFPEITYLGIHDSKADSEEITVVEKNGIRIAMLNYTYGLNGYRLPSDKTYMIDLLNDPNRIRSQIRKAKQISDFVIVFPHWGTEYVYSPDSSQKRWAQLFADEGVDLVIGTHPHVLEPIKKVTGKNGNTMICYYSLGNFVSAQSRVPRLLGGMANITLEKDDQGTRIKSYGMTPLVTHVTWGFKNFTVYKLADYTEELAKANYIHHRSSETFSAKRLRELYHYIMSR